MNDRNDAAAPRPRGVPSIAGQIREAVEEERIRASARLNEVLIAYAGRDGQALRSALYDLVSEWPSHD